ncbi:DNA methyltransferase [Lachnotalea glycerini]|uniref:DNA methyltransferase n=2 Tax=Lachnotalea glycerini TaxID=1763509 RepID=A0A371JBQ6_9FIRM|nr:DNA methyltransferase [Lachnotalea glycerini]
MKVDIYKSNKKYDIIYTDPPWKQGKGGKKKVRPNSSGGELDYPTMSLQDIKELHKNVFDNLTRDNHNVFMWTIDKYLIETEQFMKELGYTMHARIVWHKVTGMAPAFTVRYTNEYLLWFYKKGKILMLDDDVRGKYSTLITEKVERHSQKPKAAYLMLEDMFKKSTKLELFARSYRDGWDCWGNEV